MQKYDVIVVGSGPSGIFLSMELKRLKPKAKILVIEQGKPILQRHCPVASGKACVHCKPFCNITCGFSGAGAYSDGKLSLYNQEDEDIYVGGNLTKYLSVKYTKELIDYTDRIYLEMGATTKLEGIEHKSERERYKRSFSEANLNLVSIPVRHLGTEKAHDIYATIQDKLLEMGVNILFETVCENILVKDGAIVGVKTKANRTHEEAQYFANLVVISTGRKGANWLSQICDEHEIKCNSGVVDVGIRYELPDEIMKDLNLLFYEAKIIGYPLPFEDKVRTFCQNPSGFVSSEVYDNNLTLVNGHSYQEKKSTNTNLAILASHHFRQPFNQPLLYGRNIAVNTNIIANGDILVQRLGDLLTGHRSWPAKIEENAQKGIIAPTLSSAVAGDISFALGYRTVMDITQFILMIDKVVKGFACYDNLMYAPEIKFYSNELMLTNEFETSIKNLYSIGDVGGLTRGLMQASASGIHLARVLNTKI